MDRRVTIAERYAAVERRVQKAAARSHRDRGEIIIVAVAKTFDAAAIRSALDAGIVDIGENRAQELRDKMAVLGTRPRWHFVGPLQTNKVRNVAGRVSLIHSVDRYGLAEAISRRAASLDTAQDVLLEVNVAGESQKAGVEPARAVALAEEVSRLEGVVVRGLMAIPPAAADPEDSRIYFTELAALRDRVRDAVATATGLSMGMSRDFEVAVEEGATWIRIGEVIFGERRRGGANA